MIKNTVRKPFEFQTYRKEIPQGKLGGGMSFEEKYKCERDYLRDYSEYKFMNEEKRR